MSGRGRGRVVTKRWDTRPAAGLSFPVSARVHGPGPIRDVASGRKGGMSTSGPMPYECRHITGGNPNLMRAQAQNRTAPSSTRDGLPSGSPASVLIGGCPRSGTTLLGAMLGVGAERLTVPESTFKFRLLRDLRGGGDVLDTDSALRRLAVDPLFRLWDVAVPEVSVERQPSLSYASLLHDLVLSYGRAVGKPNPSFWIDHTPGNMRYAASLARALPRARFIHIIRDGRAVAASVMPLDWGPNTITQAAHYWGVHVAQGLAAAYTLGSERVLTVRFEDIVDDPERALRTTCRFLGSSYDPAMIDRRDFAVGSYTQAMHRLVGARPDRTRADAWRARLTSSQVAAFEWVTGDLLDLLGYQLVHGAHARPRSWPARLAELAADAARRGVIDRARRTLRRRKVSA